MRFRLSLRSLPNGAGHRVVDVAECDDDTENPGIIMRMLHLDLLRDPIFIIFSISNFFTSLGFNVPYVFLVVSIIRCNCIVLVEDRDCNEEFFFCSQKQAETHDIDKETASMLLSVVGFANTAGRIVLGYISDKPWVNRLFIYNVCLTVCGLCKSYYHSILYNQGFVDVMVNFYLHISYCIEPVLHRLHDPRHIQRDLRFHGRSLRRSHLGMSRRLGRTGSSDECLRTRTVIPRNRLFPWSSHCR